MTTGNLWRDRHASTIDPERFRAHDQYLEQRPDYPYRDMVEFIRAAGRGEWADRLGEDFAFGCVTRMVDGLRVSRDLLDSIVEIGWILERADWSHALDIGAGYGRIAHRLWQMRRANVLGRSRLVTCTDDIESSRAVCDIYARYRTGGTWGVSPDRLDAYARLCPFDLALNIHSWSECTLPEVQGWLDTLDRLKVPRLFHIPHNAGMGTWDMASNGPNGPSYRGDLESRGWVLKHDDRVGPESWRRVFQLWERA